MKVVVGGERRNLTHKVRNEQIIYLSSIVPATGNVYSSGLRTTPAGIEPPTFAYPNNDCPRTYSGSRDSYERLLRKLVYQPGGRIRWETGTITGLRLFPPSNALKRIESVSVRYDDADTEYYIPASLVIGTYPDINPYDIFIEVFQSDCSGASQAGMRWLKRIPEDPAKIGNYKISYNPRMRYKEFFFEVPLSIRRDLPIPGGYDNSEMILCSLFSSPPKESRTFVMIRADGHRSKWTYFVFFVPITSLRQSLLFAEDGVTRLFRIHPLIS